MSRREERSRGPRPGVVEHTLPVTTGTNAVDVGTHWHFCNKRQMEGRGWMMRSTNQFLGDKNLLQMGRRH